MHQLTQLRRNKLLTQDELGAKAGVNRMTIWRMEHGQRVSYRSVRAIADSLKVGLFDVVTPEQLLDDDPEVTRIAKNFASVGYETEQAHMLAEQAVAV